MTTAGSGAVFFLGTRAHYQVLQQPESQFDVENGNASTETIYQNHSVQELWAKDQGQKDLDQGDYGDRNWNYCDNDVTGSEEKDSLDITMGMKRRSKRRPSETTLCERDAEMKPALLNHDGESDIQKSKPSRRRINLLTFLSSLAKRKRRLDSSQIQYLHHLESFTTCTYRESCRCAECQSRYFECDESDEDYSSDESDYSPRYITQVPELKQESDEDDEVFVDTIPEDNTSTDLLIDNQQVQPPPRQMSLSSSESVQEGMEIEVAAGTPVLLNYLLTHPITCSVQ